MGDYKIGTTYGNLTVVDGLGSADPRSDPRGDPMEYANVVTLGDGTTRNLGWLRQKWHWEFMSESMRNALYAYVGSVYVYTRENDGTFGYYTGTLVWPEKEPEHYSNRVLDVNVEIRELIVYTPPPP